MRKEGGRRGELSSAQIITLVLAIAGFLIVLAFIYGFEGSTTTDTDICKLSVVGRATTSEVLAGSGAYIPLKCTTGKICITGSSSGECNQFAGEKNVQFVRLSGGLSQEKEIIESISAQTMYDCWNMMGQGKLDLVSTYAKQLGWSQGQSTCVICTRVALADDVPKELLDPKSSNSIDMNTYLATHQVPGSDKTYLQTFTDVGINAFPKVNSNTYIADSANIKSAGLSALKNTVDATAKIVSNDSNAITSLQSSVDADTKAVLAAKMANDQTALQAANTKLSTDQTALQAANTKLSTDQATMDAAKKSLDDTTLQASTQMSFKPDTNFARNEIAFVFMQIKSQSFSDALGNQVSLGAAAAGGSFAISPGKVLSASKFLFSWTGAIFALVAVGADVGFTALNTFEGQKVAAGYCGTFTSSDSAAKGCSLVQAMPYSFKDISNLCQVIQGSP
jgi:hypothetical protein